MGEVIEVDMRRPQSFTISAVFSEDNGTWSASVDYYDKQTDKAEYFREVAAALIPLAGGLIAAAEGHDASRRGLMVANFSVFEDGTVDMNVPADMDKIMEAWIFRAIDRIKEKLATLGAA